MSIEFTLSDISDFLEKSARIHPSIHKNALTKNVCTNSREASSGDIFVALRGESFDGHDFVPQAVDQGAIAVVVDQLMPSLPQTIVQYVVPDTLAAYQQIAHYWRQQFQIPVIGITGSVGKTTTKELIAAVLSQFGKVHKTQANFNNEIGVPKTLLGMTAEHDFAIIEMAMRGRGEIALLADIAQPTIGLITNVGTAHIGRLGSEAAIAEAKCELLAHQPPESVAILNRDNARLINTAATVWQGKTITYGLQGGDFHGRMENGHLLVDGLSFPLPLAGEHNALNYLAAIAVAATLGLDWPQLANQELVVELPQGRARRHQWDKDIFFLDETYNAGLESMLAALVLLAQTEGKRHIAVLGAMKELGDFAPVYHQQVGKRVADLKLDALLILANDPTAKEIAHTATGVETTVVDTAGALEEAVLNLMQPGDRLLFKASNSVGLSKVVRALMERSPL